MPALLHGATDEVGNLLQGKTVPAWLSAVWSAWLRQDKLRILLILLCYDSLRPQMTALAAALGVNVYVINLSNKLLSDEVLVDLLSGTPLRTLFN